MTQHDDSVSLWQMLDHSREAIAMAEGRSRADLNSDRMLCLALTRLVEIIGEAANRVSSDFQGQHPHIPWGQIIGLRNRLVHGYDSINLDVLWQIIAEDLPSLIEQLEAITPPHGS
jgi:uncharacterized protein with HEPN domain